MRSDLAALRQIHHRIEDDLVARLDAVMHFDFLAEVARDRDLLQMGSAVLDDRDMQAILIEYDGVGRYDHRWCLARDKQFNGAIDSGIERAVRIGNVDLGQQRPAAGLQCCRDSGDLAWKSATRNLGNSNHRDDARREPKSL